MKIERTALIMHSAQHMYTLVHHVAAYPEFLSWCTYSEVHEESAVHQLASLGVKVAGIEQKFTTRNTLHPYESIRLTLVEGPFRELAGEWRFKQLGESGSKITLELNFNFTPGLMTATFQRGFKSIADRLVQEFCRRADQMSSVVSKESESGT